ncbi:unnamed protein product [Prorocentrum cordatum]|uniref:Cyclic nucleotide-binding domain-containing protein n=1 Tax=Prorocentrum cordatum TaxID=2364126 RepID=A0ABN9TFE4_9DINO|nr:unnamed protein product [Polarella glacialis]
MAASTATGQHNGDKGRELFFMFRGKAGVFVGTQPPVLGRDEEVATYVAGNYFGELGVLTGKPRAAWIVARTYAVCSVLLPSAIEELGQKCPGAFTILVQSMVKSYKLKPSMSLEDVSALLDERFGSIEEAFDWFCKCGEDRCEDEMGSRAFDEALRRLKVPELDRKIFWAEMDSENRGSVTHAQFSANFMVREFHVAAKPPRKQSKAAAGPPAVAAREDDISAWLASLRSHPPSPSSSSVRPPGDLGGLQARRRRRADRPSCREVLGELAKSREQGRRLQEQIREARRAWTCAASADDGPPRQPPPGG